MIGVVINQRALKKILKKNYMNSLQNAPIVKKSQKLFEDSSGFKIEFFDIDHFTTSKELACRALCPGNRSECRITLKDIAANGTFYIYPCMYDFKNIFVPIYAKGQLASILYAWGRKHDQAKSSGAIAVLAQDLYEFINYVCAFESTVTSNTHLSRTSNYSEEILKSAIREIHQGYYINNLSLKVVADKCNVSYYHLSHLFKKYAGKNFIDYLTDTRIDKSKRLLKNIKLTISQVSTAVGYNDPSYFCRVFRSATKMSPMGFRRKWLAHCTHRSDHVCSRDIKKDNALQSPGDTGVKV